RTHLVHRSGEPSRNQPFGRLWHSNRTSMVEPQQEDTCSEKLRELRSGCYWRRPSMLRPLQLQIVSTSASNHPPASCPTGITIIIAGTSGGRDTTDGTDIVTTGSEGAGAGRRIDTLSGSLADGCTSGAAGTGCPAIGCAPSGNPTTCERPDCPGELYGI